MLAVVLVLGAVVPVPGAGAVSWLCTCWVLTGCRVLNAGAGCCELAVRVVETGCRCWVLAVRVVETACRCRVLVLAALVVETHHAVLRFFQCTRGAVQKNLWHVFAIWNLCWCNFSLTITRLQ